MPRHATAQVEDAELKPKDLAPPEEMERRRQFVARLRSRMAAPMEDSEKDLLREFMAELEREPLKFRF